MREPALPALGGTFRELTVALDGASLAATVALAVLLAADVTGPARVVLTLFFAAYVPGRAVVTNWPAMLGHSQFALPVVFSLSIMTLTASVAVWVHAWNPVALFCVVGAASTGALAVALRRTTTAELRRRARRGAVPPDVTP